MESWTATQSGWRESRFWRRESCWRDTSRFEQPRQQENKYVKQQRKTGTEGRRRKCQAL